MFSSRLDWDLPLNPLGVLLRNKRNAGAEILDLTESNPTAAGFTYSEEILRAIADPRSLVYRPSPAGAEEARAAVASLHGVDPQRVLLTSSTSEAYSWLFKLLADPGDEVLVPSPSYPLFEFLAALESVRVVEYPLVYDGAWSIDLDALARAVTGRTRAVIVVNPNNPTGSFLKRYELEALFSLNLPIICDEVFAPYAFGPDPERVATLIGCDRTLSFSLGGLSKLCGLPQMKLGWIVVNGPDPAQARERLELIADTYLSVGTPVQIALPCLLAAGIRDQIARRVGGNLEFLRSCSKPLAVEGGWYAILEMPRTRTEEEWTLGLLDEHNVLVHPGFFFDFEREAFLVLSLLAPAAVFQESVRRIQLQARL